MGSQSLPAVTEKTIECAGSLWRVDPGFNLYVDITSACNASCAFCIAPTVGRRDGPEFFAGARFALDLAESVGGTIQIVGGEPTISRRLPELLRKIGERNYRRVILNTNGTGLTSDLAAEMAAAGVTCVNVSRHHWREDLNQDIMHLRPELSNVALQSGVERILRAGMRVRMQCNLIAGYVDTWPKMQEYLRWCASLDCREVSFSQVFPLSLFDYQTPIEPGYTELIQIDLRKLVAEIDMCSEYSTASPGRVDTFFTSHGNEWGNHHRCGGKRKFWYGAEGATFSLKTLSGYDKDGLPNLTTYDKTRDPELQEGFLAFAVLHADGRMTASWDTRERVLFAPTRAQRSLVSAG